MTTSTGWLEQVLHDRYGFDLTTLDAGHLAAAVKTRSRAIAIPLEGYVASLQRSPAELDALLEELVVSETWFHREPAALASVVDYARECFKRHGDRRLRVLSVPCATGEEPFSIAMALADSLGSADRFDIVGIDLSRRALQRASSGTYRESSFRGADLSYRQRWFEAAGPDWKVHAALRRAVRFERCNVVGEAALPSLEQPYDVILCRNLLIYLHDAARQAVFARLHAAMSEDGVLSLGSSEASLSPAALFSPLGRARHACFQKKGAGGNPLATTLGRPEIQRPAPTPHVTKTRPTAAQSATRAAPAIAHGATKAAPAAAHSLTKAAPAIAHGATKAAPAAAHSLTKAPPALAHGASKTGSTAAHGPTKVASSAAHGPTKAASTAAHSTAKAAPAAAPDVSTASLDAAQELADRGQFKAAEALCQAHLRAASPTARGLYLLGLISSSDGRVAEAEKHLRQALYLEPQQEDALLLLALLNEQQGRTQNATALRRRLQRSQQAP